MNPILFESTAKSFNNNGIGILSDAAFCEVTEERNGIFELVLNYPISGLHYSKIKYRSIILAKPNATAKAQPFRVYKITKPINGIVTAYAQHISYDLSGNPVLSFTAGSAAAALQALKNNSVGENPFEFWTDKSTVAEMAVKTPASVRAMLGGVSGSILDTYGGEYEWDGFTVKLYNKRGQNRGVSIRYGKNLIDLNQEENCAGVYTAVMPFWADNEGNTIILDEKTVPVEGTFDFERVFVLDLSSEFENQPTKEELRLRTEKYIEANKIGIPHVSINLSFVQLEQTEEYKNKALLERVSLCDEVNVVFEKLRVSATAKVIKTVYNVLLNRYESVELGDAKNNFADTIVKQEQAIKEAPKKAVSLSAQAAEKATQLITGNRGGYVVIHSSTGAKEPDEILIMDKPTIEEAVKVWRWNNSGLGYSETGYSGTYTTAWTIDGAFNADFITAGTISANLIKTGFLKSLNEVTSVDMDTGTIRIKLYENSEMALDANGIQIYNGNEAVHKYTGLETVSNYADFDFLRVHDAATNNVVSRVVSSSVGGVLSLCNKEEKETVAVSATNVGGTIIFYKHEGTTGIPLAIFKADETNGGQLSLKDKNGRTWFNSYINGSGSSVLDLHSTSSGEVDAQMAVVNGKGQFVVLSDGAIKGAFVATSSGAELRVGGGSSSWKTAWNNGESHLQADHFHFKGATDGLITGAVSADECSAYIVAMKPTSNGGYVSIIIPSAGADGSTLWQIADDSKFCNFTIDSSGNIDYVNGTNITGTAIVYSIR